MCQLLHLEGDSFPYVRFQFISHYLIFDRGGHTDGGSLVCKTWYLHSSCLAWRWASNGRSLWSSPISRPSLLHGPGTRESGWPSPDMTGRTVSKGFPSQDRTRADSEATEHLEDRVRISKLFDNLLPRVLHTPKWNLPRPRHPVVSTGKILTGTDLRVLLSHPSQGSVCPWGAGVGSTRVCRSLCH